MPHLKIALVEAVSKSTHVYSRTYLPRAGVATLGAVLKQLGYRVDIFIHSLSDLEEQHLATYDVVGIGSLSSTIEEAYRLADWLRRQRVTVVMGGPHVTFMPEEAVCHCDFAVIGEGEGALPALLAAIENKTPFETVRESLLNVRTAGFITRGRRTGWITNPCRRRIFCFPRR